MNLKSDYSAPSNRYKNMSYRRCGRSGIKLPILSLGLWQNFGTQQPLDKLKEILFYAFDNGITHFDLANNYGPPYGSAEENFGLIFNAHLRKYRDELIISTKAGYDMWPGPYGEWGSRKYLLSSLDQSLKRMGIEYVDIFYSHRFDPETPLEETISALETAYKQGKALYVGISSYSAKQTQIAEDLLKSKGMHCLIHQPSYSLLNRWIEKELISTLDKLGIGSIVFSPLAQGLLSQKYISNELPSNTRIKYSGSISSKHLKEENLTKIKALNEIAERRGQTLPQMAIAWVLRKPQVTSALIGVSRLSQLQENLEGLNQLTFTEEELTEIEKYAQEGNINIWKKSSSQ